MEGLFLEVFICILNSEGKKNREIVLHRGRKEIVCDYQKKTQPPLL